MPESRWEQRVEVRPRQVVRPGRHAGHAGGGERISVFVIPGASIAPCPNSGMGQDE